MFEASEHHVAIRFGLGFGPGLPGIAGGGVDENEIIMVVRRGVGGIGSRADGDVDGRFGRADFLAMDFVEFARIIVREKNVVMGQARVAAPDAEE